jgi:hypothetical protein
MGWVYSIDVLLETLLCCEAGKSDIDARLAGNVFRVGFPEPPVSQHALPEVDYI